MSVSESPCVRNCCLNERDICVGCQRSLQEIKDWGQASDATKQAIMERIKNLGPIDE